MFRRSGAFATPWLRVRRAGPYSSQAAPAGILVVGELLDRNSWVEVSPTPAPPSGGQLRCMRQTSYTPKNHQPLARGTAASWMVVSQVFTLFVCPMVSSSSRLRFSPRGLRPASNCPATRSEKLACGSNGTWTCCIAGQIRLSMSWVG
jgi:hypothetical protein